jgi:hypothetical protein
MDAAPSKRAMEQCLGPIAVVRFDETARTIIDGHTAGFRTLRRVVP